MKTPARTSSFILTLALAAACGGEDRVIISRAAPPGSATEVDALEPSAEPGAAAPSTPSVAAGAAGSSAAGPAEADPAAPASPVFVIANEVYTADGSNSYLHVLSSLDVQALDDTRAVEYAGGRATIQSFGGALYVAGPESPVITRFEISPEGGLLETGAVSFANYPFASVVIDDWSVTFIDAAKAYLFNGVDGSTVIFDPTTLEIRGEVEQTRFDLAREAPLSINYSPGVVSGGRLFRTVSWDDWDAGRFSVEQYLAIYDLETDALIELIPESRCPSLGSRVSRDEAGNAYFSNWIWNVGETLLAGGPKNCALRLDAGSARLRDDWTLPYASLTDGREAAIFQHLSGQQALLSVFYDERASIDSSTAPDELMSTNNWRVWSVDVAGGTGAPIEGLDWMAGAASSFQLGGRTWLFVPADDWSVTHVYELAGDRARFAFDVDGWSFQLVQVR